MSLSRISLHNIRSYGLESFEFDPGVTLILGPNGSGKTTILEAVYYMLRGTSFRGRDRDIIAYEKDSSEVKLEFSDTSVRRSRVSTTPEGRALKQFRVGANTAARLSPKDRLPVVLFEPDELRLLTSSPQRRRDFIDGIIARLSPTYSTVLSRFNRALLQRNELLKRRETMDEDVWQNNLFAWDIKFSELSASIIKARSNFIVHANDHLSRIYSDLANSTHSVIAEYSSTFSIDDGLQQALLSRLEATRDSDCIRGFTSIGPHRDDFFLHLDNYPAADSASRGEMRTIMLAFKLLEVELQEHHTGQKPIILLDDVFSELDSSREQSLIRYLLPYQTIITATDLRDELKMSAVIISLAD
ncbi:MAG: DNA replication and repair protein RecF [Candidatus Saccharimonadales bacterium]